MRTAAWRLAGDEPLVDVVVDRSTRGCVSVRTWRFARGARATHSRPPSSTATRRCVGVLDPAEVLDQPQPRRLHDVGLVGLAQAVGAGGAGDGRGELGDESLPRELVAFGRAANHAGDAATGLLRCAFSATIVRRLSDSDQFLRLLLRRGQLLGDLASPPGRADCPHCLRPKHDAINPTCQFAVLSQGRPYTANLAPTANGVVQILAAYA